MKIQQQHKVQQKYDDEHFLQEKRDEEENKSATAMKTSLNDASVPINSKEYTDEPQLRAITISAATITANRDKNTEKYDSDDEEDHKSWKTAPMTDDDDDDDEIDDDDDDGQCSSGYEVSMLKLATHLHSTVPKRNVCDNSNEIVETSSTTCLAAAATGRSILLKDDSSNQKEALLVEEDEDKDIIIIDDSESEDEDGKDDSKISAVENGGEQKSAKQIKEATCSENVIELVDDYDDDIKDNTFTITGSLVKHDGHKVKLTRKNLIRSEMAFNPICEEKDIEELLYSSDDSDEGE